VRAAGGLLHYVEETQKTVQAPLQPLCTYTLAAYLVIDHQTRRNLEITQTRGTALTTVPCCGRSIAP
jgi:DNA mismatch repair protein MutS